MAAGLAAVGLGVWVRKRVRNQVSVIYRDGALTRWDPPLGVEALPGRVVEVNGPKLTHHGAQELADAILRDLSNEREWTHE